MDDLSCDVSCDLSCDWMVTGEAGKEEDILSLRGKGEELGEDRGEETLWGDDGEDVG